MVADAQLEVEEDAQYFDAEEGACDALLQQQQHQEPVATSERAASLALAGGPHLIAGCAIKQPLLAAFGCSSTAVLCGEVI